MKVKDLEYSNLEQRNYGTSRQHLEKSMLGNNVTRNLITNKGNKEELGRLHGFVLLMMERGAR